MNLSTASDAFVPRDRLTAETHTLLHHGANLLIIADKFVFGRVLGSLWPSLERPIQWTRGSQLRIPEEAHGTVILQEPDRLSARDQTDLLDWLNDRGRSVRVFTVASRAMFPLVETGRFLPALYYRLNHVLVEVDAHPPRPYYGD